MNKKMLIIITAVVLLIGLIVAGYLYWQKTKAKPEEQALEKAGEAAEKITESATKGVLPSLKTNPLENQPDINPASQANPFKNIKTNPFE
jgi:predicted negative regulator of RcsB-dependent stress response